MSILAPRSMEHDPQPHDGKMRPLTNRRTHLYSMKMISMLQEEDPPLSHYFSCNSTSSAALSGQSGVTNLFEAMEDWESDSDVEEIAHPGSLPALGIGSRGGLAVAVGLGTHFDFDEYQEESDILTMTHADTDSPDSPDLSSDLSLLAPKAHSRSYIPPPSEKQAKIALEKLTLVLQPPHKTGAGYKDPGLDILTHCRWDNDTL